MYPPAPLMMSMMSAAEKIPLGGKPSSSEADVERTSDGDKQVPSSQIDNSFLQSYQPYPYAYYSRLNPYYYNAANNYYGHYYPYYNNNHL